LNSVGEQGLQVAAYKDVVDE